jgi:hypothetical protein
MFSITFALLVVTTILTAIIVDLTTKEEDF